MKKNIVFITAIGDSKTLFKLQKILLGDLGWETWALIKDNYK
jgi:hypothetical protein